MVLVHQLVKFYSYQLATLDLVIEQVFKLLSMSLFKLKVLVVQESFLLEQQQYLTDT